MSLSIFDKYLLKHVTIATVLVSLTLACVIMLTQSLRFLELVIQSGASSLLFWHLTVLALPKFLEVIVPVGIMAATAFTYNRMTADSELIIMRAAGNSPLRLARPALILSLILTVMLWGVTMWASPASLTKMQSLKQEIKTQYSVSLIREGVFNDMKNGITVYMKQRTEDGELRGLMIHDNRPELPSPVTILAKYGKIISASDGYQVIVYDGLRQEYNHDKKNLSNLNFERYTIDLPDENAQIEGRWQKPAERSFIELFYPDLNNVDDQKKLRDFNVEIHKRIISPLLTPCFAIIALIALLSGPIDRRGLSTRIMMATSVVILVQGLYLVLFNLAKDSDAGLIGMYVITIAPVIIGLFTLSEHGERFRRGIFYRPKQRRQS